MAVRIILKKYLLSIIGQIPGFYLHLQLLYPDSNLFVSAECHAVTAENARCVGHERQGWNCKAEFSGECCQYGEDDALEIIMNLLIDNNIKSIGHRLICMASCYSKIGLAKRYHSKFQTNTVIDFAEVPDSTSILLGNWKPCVELKNN